MPTRDFIEGLGLPFLAHRLRRLSERLVDGYAAWLPSVGVSAPARSLSLLMLLRGQAPLSVTEIAARLRLSHPLIIKHLEALLALGFVAFEADPLDRRRRLARLTPVGMAEVGRIEAATARISRAYAELARESGFNLLAGLEAAEQALARRDLLQRLEAVDQAATEEASADA